MDDRVSKAILRRLRDTEHRMVRYRLGKVTALSPLTIALGGDTDNPITGVRSLSAVAVNDVVAVAAFGRSFLILGKLIDGTASSARSGLGLNFGTYYAVPVISSAATTVLANIAYYTAVQIRSDSTITGVGFYSGATNNGTQRAALYDSTGARVANRTTNFTPAGATTFQKIAFDSPYAAVPGIYYASVVFSSATQTAHIGRAMTPSSAAAGPGGGATATSITPPTSPADAIAMSTY